MVVAKKSRAQMVQRTWDVAGRGENVVEFTRACEEYRRNDEDAQGWGGAARGRAVIPGVSRRAFLGGVGGFVAGAVIARSLFSDAANFYDRVTAIRSSASNVGGERAELLYPPVDLSYFEKQIGCGA
jgi:hypothetical protein